MESLLKGAPKEGNPTKDSLKVQKCSFNNIGCLQLAAHTKDRILDFPVSVHSSDPVYMSRMAHCVCLVFVVREQTRCCVSADNGKGVDSFNEV